MNNSSTANQTTQPRKRASRWLWMGGCTGAFILLAVAALAFMWMRMGTAPAQLDVATTRTSEAGLYQVTYTGSLTPVPINQIHTWTLHVENAAGQPVENAVITVGGDMPQHGHGLPTEPQVTQALGNGDYLVEGMKFQMGGWWVVEFVITADGQTDKVSFNLRLSK